MGEIDERLETIKREGRARRVRRSRRNTAVLGAAFCVVAVAAVAGPWADNEANGPRTTDLAARGPGGDCRNSVSPECGELRWDPEPVPNQLATVIVETPDPGVAGEPLTIAVSWTDADAPRATAWVCWGDAACEAPAEPCVNAEAAGPWTPPDPAAGGGSLPGLSHTYAAPGRYSVTVMVRTASWPEGRCAPALGDPFSDTVSDTVEVEIR